MNRLKTANSMLWVPPESLAAPCPTNIMIKILTPLHFGPLAWPCINERPSPEPLAHNLTATAQITGHSTRTLRRLVKRGLLRPSKASRKFVFARREIERFLNETTLD